MELILENVFKKYSKDKFGVVDFSLKLNNGIIGLLGPNGAGKSTLMKMIATISNPTSGSITLNGRDIIKHPNDMRQSLGYLPQDFGVYPNLTGYEFLEYIAALKGIGGVNLKTKVLQLLEGVNLIEASKKPIGSYSGGMKQRIGIAQVLLNDPKILIFDEPTVGLDPEERVRFRNLISELANDCIIILSSHIVSDIETIADEVAIMKSGKLIAKGFQSDIINTVTNKVFEIEISKDELTSFKEKYLVVNTIRRKDAVLVRFIADTKLNNAVVCISSLEDAYLFLSKQ
ncbi:MAG: ABC transporter ATP-binding protein [Cyclobacteriaceae bacterium]|nr:ABC transporter ATP-binding protein [Cyclobacteriaceae bacterium]